MKIVFAGTPEAAVPSLELLSSSSYVPELVITRPDAPIGRKRILTPSPVATSALNLALPVLKTNKLDASVQSELDQNFDLGVIIAFGGLVKEPILSLPKHGWINLHFSKLPNWRGAAPVQRAIQAGESEIGLTIFRLVAELDAGPILLEKEVPLSGKETSAEALELLAKVGANFIVEAVKLIDSGDYKLRYQVGQSSYAKKLEKSDQLIDPNLSAVEVFNHYRAMTPEPGAVLNYQDSALKIIELSAPDPQGSSNLKLQPGEIGFSQKKVYLGTSTEPLEVLKVQPSGKSVMVAADWWRGQTNKK